MFNIGLWFLSLIISFVLVLILYRFLGLNGLYLWIVFATIMANLQVNKTIEIFGMIATLGNVLYASLYLATDIISEHYSKKKALRATIFGFSALIFFLIYSRLTLAFIPHEDDYANAAMQTLFNLAPRILIASLIAFLISQVHDIYAYHFWRKKLPSMKWLWLRNNASTLLSQLFDTLIFVFIAFYGVYSLDIVWEIALSTYLLKALCSLLDTPFLYLSTKIKLSEKV